MMFNLFRRVLNNVGREAVASSSKTRVLRLESLENRELLDAAGGESGVIAQENPVVPVSENVGQIVDLVASINVGSVNETEAATTLDAPESFELGEYDVDTEKLPMQWSSVDDAKGYRVEYTTDGGKSWKLGAIVDQDVTSRLASKVHMDLEYVFRVQAFNETTSSEWTYSEPFYYSSGVPKGPQEFRLGEYDSETLSLTMEWDKVAYSNGYRVQYTTDGGTSWYNAETLVGADSTSRTARKVYADREYQFRVSSYNKVGISEWTYSAKFHVNYAELESPDNISIGEYDATNRTLPLNWSAVDNASGYEVQYSLDQGKTWRLAEKLYGGDSVSRLATHVIPGTTYDFRVRAYNEVGMSDWTYSSQFTPPAILTAPKSLDVVFYDPLSRQLGLVWDDVPEEDGYKIEYSTDGGATWVVAFKTEADVTEGVAEGILANTDYLFHVRAYNATDISPWTETSFRFGDDAATKMAKIWYR